jgi:hypothetical protein
MKKPVFPHTVALLALGLSAPLSAQNLTNHSTASDYPLIADGLQQRFSSATPIPGTFEVPALERAKGDLSCDQPVIAAQDAVTLESTENRPRDVGNVIDLDLLRNPSRYRKYLVSTHGQPYRISEDSLETGLALISALYRETGKFEPESDCSAIALSVGQQLKLDPSMILEIVEREVGANPTCSCEVVKTAITATEADADQVVAIVEAAILASPESMRIISQCAIATMPDSVAGVQALLAKLDPNAGESGYSSKSAKSAKSAKAATIVAPPLPNPLDRPPPMIFPPPPIFPPFITDVNPGSPSR